MIALQNQNGCFCTVAKPARSRASSGSIVRNIVGPIIPVIYNLDLRDPSGYFLAQKFEMRNKDVIYTSNAATVETTKFLQFIRLIMATANDPITYATNGLILRNTIQGTGSTTVISGVVQ